LTKKDIFIENAHKLAILIMKFKDFLIPLPAQDIFRRSIEITGRGRMNQKHTILIVEDSRTQAVELQFFLEQNDYTTQLAHSGQEALKLLKKSIPDIIITDIVMPEMNGYELCTAVRSDKRTKHLPVVLLTSLSSPDDVIEGLKCGADNFITKPFDKNGLLSRIRYILLNKELRESQPPSLGLSLYFGGKKHVITAERTQILDLFFSSFETAIEKNRQLEKTVKELFETQAFLSKAKSDAEKAMHEAEKAKAARGMFLANITHELRTPLTAVIGTSELLAETGLNSQQIDYLNIIKNASECLLAQINNILDFSKIDAGMLELHNSDFDLYELVTVATSIFTKQVADKNIFLDVNIAPGTPRYLIGDESKLRQIFINLLSNAVKNTNNGGVHLKVNSSSSASGKAKFKFDFIDTGVGIPENKQTTLFEAFVQADNEASRLHGGTGLGLAIVKQLTDKMGGSITMKSKEGEGSAFSIELELPLSPKTKDDFHHNKQADTSRFANKIKNGKLLIVEDSKVNLQVVTVLLENDGFDYEIAFNGQEACDIYKDRGEEFNLILMDCQMPVMNGYEAATEIRRIEKEKDVAKPIPIIALSAGDSLCEKEKCTSAGMNDFIEKPFNKPRLHKCLNKWLAEA
jgi:signal transduction histidine kinase